jgi:trimeric autotransporter adhesin
MPSQKISQLPVTTASSGADLYTLVQGGVNKKISFSDLVLSIGSINSMTSVTGDVVGVGPGATATTVAFVGGQSAATIAAAAIAVGLSTSSNVPGAVVKRDGSGNFSAGLITANLVGNISGSALSFTGPLFGDVTGTQGATVVSFVGGQSAASVASTVVSVSSATSSGTPNTIVERDSSGNFSANNVFSNLTGNVLGNLTGSVTGSVSGSAVSFTGALGGDVTGTQGATTVSFVGGQSAVSVAASTVAAQAATSLNTASTIVKRDSSGNFSAGTITANLSGDVTGNLTGNASTATNASTVTTNANLTGPVTSVGNTTSIANGAISNAMLANAAVASLSGTNTGDVTLTAVGATPNANGASLSGQALTLQPADSTNPGVLTTGAQTIAGSKTFTSAIIGNVSGSATSITGINPVSTGGTGSTTFTQNSFIYFNGTNLVNDIGITTDTLSNLTVLGSVTAYNGILMWTPGQLLATAAGYALPKKSK